MTPVMPIERSLLLLGLPWAMGVVALAVDRSGPVSRFMLVVAAGLFGLASGLRVLAAPLPGPGALHFVTVATFTAGAFHRAWRGIQKTVG